jgi:hypothetical protein
MDARRSALACLILLLLPVTPAAAQEAFLGTWKVTDAKVAPWYDGNGANPVIDPKLAHATITLAKNSIKGPQPLGCRKVKYTVSTVGPEDLFEGGLKNPKQDAAALGFKSDKIVSANEGCMSIDADIEMDFPMIDNDTIVFGLNNVVYTMKRADAAPAKSTGY